MYPKPSSLQTRRAPAAQSAVPGMQERVAQAPSRQCWPVGQGETTVVSPTMSQTLRAVAESQTAEPGAQTRARHIPSLHVSPAAQSRNV